VDRIERIVRFGSEIPGHPSASCNINAVHTPSASEATTRSGPARQERRYQLSDASRVRSDHANEERRRLWINRKVFPPLFAVHINRPVSRVRSCSILRVRVDSRRITQPWKRFGSALASATSRPTRHRPADVRGVCSRPYRTVCRKSRSWLGTFAASTGGACPLDRRSILL